MAHAPQFYDALVAGLPSLTGKVVAVTGCTSGTGLAFAKAAAARGATVALLNRASARADAAAAAVRQHSTGRVLSVACDLADFGSVRAGAALLAREFEASGIDVLCNNAGVMAMADRATKDGYDVQMQTNHLSHFLLTAELFPLLAKAAERTGDARVVNHSSLARKSGGRLLDARYFGKNGGNLGGDPEGCAPFQGPAWERYQQSKLANVVFAYALHDRLAAARSPVKSLVAHPGVAMTGLQASSEALDEASVEVVRGRAQACEDGALGLLTCAFLPVQSGEFYGPIDHEGRRGEAKLLPEEELATPASRDLLWRESEKAVDRAFVVVRSAL